MRFSFDKSDGKGARSSEGGTRCSFIIGSMYDLEVISCREARDIPTLVEMRTDFSMYAVTRGSILFCTTL